MSKFYSIQEAANYLQVDYKVVYRLVRQGSIPSSRVGWQYRMTQEDLNAYLNAQRLRQSIQAPYYAPSPPNASTSEPTPSVQSAHTQANGSAKMETQLRSSETESGITKVQARQMEQNLINRFNQKVRSIDTVRHPTSQTMLRIDNWEELYSRQEDREGMMRALNTAFLDRTTLATTPRNSCIAYTIPHNPDLIVEIRYVSHLDRYCQDGRDDEPADVEDLMVVIDELEERTEQSSAVVVAGLASPTGWDEKAIGYIVNSGRGNTYSHPQISILLIDLRSEQVYYNEHQATSATFVGLFRLADETEDQAALEEQLIAELADRSGLILSEFARENEVSEELALQAARSLITRDGYRLLEDRNAGWILVTT